MPFRFIRKSLAYRLVAGAALWIAVALVAGGLTLAAIFEDYVNRSFDVRLRVHLDGLVSASAINADGNIVVARPLVDPRFSRPYSGWYWQIMTAGGESMRSRSLWDQTMEQVLGEDIEKDVEGEEIQAIIKGQKLRVLGIDISMPGADGPVRYMVAGETTEIENEIAKFNKTLFWSLGVLGLVLVIAVFIQVRFGLFPLRRIHQSLSLIRSGKASHLEGSFPDEIEPLAKEINSLLDHNTEVLERARTHVGNLAHALKTPLTVLANQKEGVETPLGETVAKQSEIMRRYVDHYLSQARTAATTNVLGARTEVLPVIEDLRRTLKRIYAERAIELEVAGDPELSFRGERHDLEEILGNLIDNGCKYARSRVWVTVESKGQELQIIIEDDGPGVAKDKRDEVFSRGKRIDEAKPGSGLGLSIVLDSVGLYGGAVKLEDSTLGGLKVTLTLPAVAGDESEERS